MRALVLGVAVILLTGGAASADESMLPGHALSARDATARADTVFLGQLVGLDSVNAKSGKGEYIGKVIYVSRPANGIRPARTTQNTTVRIPAIPSDLGIAVTMTVGANEKAPEIGKSYLFYAKDNKRPGETGYDAVKVSPTGDRVLPKRL